MNVFTTLRTEVKDCVVMNKMVLVTACAMPVPIMSDAITASEVGSIKANFHFTISVFCGTFKNAIRHFYRPSILTFMCANREAE